MLRMINTLNSNSNVGKV